MPRSKPLAAMPEAERREFCRLVMESLADLVDGDSLPAWRDRVEEVLRHENGFRALCDTLKEVVSLARECGAEAAADIDDAALRDAVERVRERLRRLGEEGP